ncbi:putative Calcium/calmodulin-dependent protein kinase [Verrucomicrobia bacterium]|nr:putative Calcium/calmodulin-dependent protein kinase [Verrucomicrobiota bacterium]
MSSNETCQHCGKAIGPKAVGGLCAECLMKVGLGSGVQGEPGAPPKQKTKAPAVSEVAKLFPQLEVLELVGEGGMGAVYKARQPELDRLVALKVLPTEGGDPGFAERFTREARALAALNHPNIIAVHEFGQVDGLHYFIMEFVDGVNLRQLERAGKLTPREALQIIPQICEALQFAHDAGIVHRDIKPENVLLDKKGRVKIADFGLAKILGHGPKDLRLTGVGDVMGTPHYMAPEQVEHPQQVDHRADIYSLGVVFYEMLTGELPLGKFAAPSRKAAVDERLDEVVLRTLEKEPERRYQQAGEVKTEVETIAAQPGRLPAARAKGANLGWTGWAARLLGLLGFLFVLLFIAGDGFPTFWTQPPRVQAELVATLLMLAGLLVGWKSEGWGAFLIADGWAVFFVVERSLPPVPFTAFLVVAVLYGYRFWNKGGMAGWLSRAANRPAKRWLLGVVAGLSLIVALLPALLTGCAGVGKSGAPAAQQSQPAASHPSPLAWLREEGIDLDQPAAKKAPYTQVSIEDLQADGSSRFHGVIRETISGGEPRDKIQFISANSVETQKIFDADGNLIPFRTIHSAPNYQYSAPLAKPVPPGSALLYGSEGIIRNRAVEDPELGSFGYEYTHYPGSGSRTRLVQIFRLPRGAQLLEVSAKGTRRVHRGRTEIVFDELLPPGGGGDLAFRYRLAGGNAPTTSSALPQTPPLAEQPAQQPQAAQEPPEIVATSPRPGDTEVDPAITEITVTFDRDMEGGFSWTGGGPEFPSGTPGQKPSWRGTVDPNTGLVASRRTCVLPVQLEAGHYYRVGINSPSFQSFRSVAGVAAEASAIYFTTRGASEELQLKVRVPKLVSLEPANGATDVSPAVTELRVTFDLPMGGGFSWCGGGPSYPEGQKGKAPHWTEDHKTCILPVSLKPSYTYELSLNCPCCKNFKSAAGVPLEPLGYTFTTKAGPVSQGEGEPFLRERSQAALTGDYWAKYALWASYQKGDHGVKPDAALAKKWLQEVVTNVWLVKFEPAAGFRPTNPGQFLDGIHQYSHTYSGEHALGSGFFRTTRQSGKLIGSFLTDAPDRLKAALEQNPNLKFLSVEAITPEKFVEYDRSPQESLSDSENSNERPAFTPALAEQAFDQLWEAFDREYAMFALRPEVDWGQLRQQYRPQALGAKSADELARVFAQMLRPLRDLHIWLKVAGSDVPVFNRPRSANANPSAVRALLGNLNDAGAGVRWGLTTDKVGYLAIRDWSNPAVPRRCYEALENLRDTRGLIVDVRLNGGGSEDLAEEVAGRFLEKSFVYAYSQFRNGPSHTNLTEKYERAISSRGPWRYNRPVVLLIGQKCMSSNESFVGMMSGDPELTTMGDHTCGSSGNPRMVQLPLGITVSVPRWIDYLPDGTPLDERGFQPQVPFQPGPGAFDGGRDDLFSAALERLRQAPMPDKPIEGSRFGGDS